MADDNAALSDVLAQLGPEAGIVTRVLRLIAAGASDRYVEIYVETYIEAMGELPDRRLFRDHYALTPDTEHAVH